MELFVLGLVFGAATAQGKAVTKAVAKGYMAVSEKTREVVSTLREDMRGAIEEAKEERDQADPADEAPGHEAEALALREEFSPVGGVNITTSQTAATVASAATVSTPTSTSSGTAKQTPTVIKSLAKKYMAVTEKTRDAVSGIRENVRDAIEEARYERELSAQRAGQAEADAPASTESEVVTPEAVHVVNPAPVKMKSSPAARSTRTRASGVKTVGEAPKPARSTRTNTAQASTTPAPVPAKRGRPRKDAGAQRVSASDALLEVAEIAADAL